MSSSDDDGVRRSPSRSPVEREGPDAPPASLPSPEERPRHYYPIERHQVYSLREASVALDLPEGTLRRAILLEEIASEVVDDDRHYLIQGAALQDYVRFLRPQEQCEFPDGMTLWSELALVLVIPVLILFVLLLTRTAAPSRPVSPAPSLPPAAGVPGDPSDGILEKPSPVPRPLESELLPGPTSVPEVPEH
ncbi:MAG TPA: hypothetical protein VKW04_14930 [Planctomycetota bacterium]|nr:hypothetical protein [Planctomycetota bacterium]